MIDLTQDKAKYLNPLVTRFLKINLQFFKKQNLTWHEQLGSVDADGMKETAGLYGSKSQTACSLLHRMEHLSINDNPAT
jgi:hypothetical protein